MSETGSNPMELERAEAARLLRAARTARSSAEAGELIGWAFLALPESRPVRRMKIAQLLAEGDTVAAEALIAQGLLTRPSDPALTALRARTLLDQGRIEAADGEIRVVLDQRPTHAAVLVLAGRIARRRGDHGRAIDLLQRAIARRPHDEAMRRTLVQWHLDAGEPQKAELALADLAWPDPLLPARVLRAQGRRPDAAHLLERNIARAEDGAQLDRELAELVEIVEEMGDTERLRATIDRIDGRMPRALLCATRALLALGVFGRAATSAAELAGTARWRRAALPILIAAAALDGRPEVARRALDQVPGGPLSLDPRAVADSWRRGMIGATIASQRSASRAGADPSRSVLQPLLQDALRVFEGELAATGHGESGGTESERHRADCLAAMGRTLEAAASWARATGDEPSKIGRIAPPPAARPFEREAA